MTIMKSRELFINILIGIVLISIPFLSSPDLKSGITLLKIQPFQRSLLSYVFLLLFLYANYYYFIPKFYINKRWFILALVLISSYLIISQIPSLIIPEDPRFKPPTLQPIAPPEVPFDLRLLPMESHLFQFFMVFILTFHLRVNNHLKNIQSEKLRTEVSYLKAQINPHFLFNTLNSIYALALKKSDLTAKAVLRLSNIMRYVVTDSDQQQVSLPNEINYINDYIDLQKIRLTKMVLVDFKIDGTTDHYTIAPMLLMTFVENAFKYGVSQEKSSKISIFMSIKEKHKLVFKVENSNFNNETFDGVSTHEGLKNTQMRLHYLYPNKHHLTITETPETYNITLEIALDHDKSNRDR